MPGLLLQPVGAQNSVQALLYEQLVLSGTTAAYGSHSGGYVLEWAVGSGVALNLHVVRPCGVTKTFSACDNLPSDWLHC